jgi:hypothetical protein
LSGLVAAGFIPARNLGNDPQFNCIAPGASPKASVRFLPAFSLGLSFVCQKLYFLVLSTDIP